MTKEFKTKERVRKIIEYLRDLFPIEYKDYFIHIRAYDEEKSKAYIYFIKIEDLYNDEERIIRGLTKFIGTHEKQRRNISLLYNPVSTNEKKKEESKTPAFTINLHFDVDIKKGNERIELTDEIIEKVSKIEPKPYIIVSSGKGIHLIYRLSKEIDIKQHKKVSEKIVSILKEKIKEVLGDNNLTIEIEKYNPKDILRLPYTYNFKYEPPILAIPKIINPNTILDPSPILEQIKKEEEEAKFKKELKGIEKVETAFIKGKLNYRKISPKLANEIVEIFKQNKLLRPHRTHNILLAFSSWLIKNGYRKEDTIELIKRLIIEVRLEGEEKESKIKEHLEQTINYLWKQVEELYQKDVNELRQTLLQITKERKLNINVNTLDKDTIIYLIIKYKFAGLNLLEELKKNGEINEEEYKTLVHVFFKTRIKPYRPLPNKVEMVIGFHDDMPIKIVYENGEIQYVSPRDTVFITKDGVKIFLKDVIEIEKSTSTGQDYELIFDIIVKKFNKTRRYVGTFDDLEDKIKKYINTSIDKGIKYISDLFTAKAKPRITLRAYNIVGLAYDKEKGIFVPTYLGYEHYYSTLYGLHKQQRMLLMERTYDELALMIKKLRESNSEVYKEAIKYLKEFFDLAKIDETYHFNVLMNYGYILGSIVITSLMASSIRVIPSYPFILNFDKVKGGTGKTTMCNILMKLVLGINNLLSVENLSKSSTGSYARLRLYVSTFSFAIIIDEFKEEIVKQNKDLLALLRDISTGSTISTRALGTESTETFQLIAPVIINTNFDIREYLDNPTIDRFIALEYKKQFRKSEESSTNIYSKYIDFKFITNISKPEITWAYRLFEDLANLLNEKYKVEGIMERLRYYNDMLISVSNTMIRNGYSIILFGLELHNELMKMYGFGEEYMINIDELIDRINQSYEEFQTYDEEFYNVMSHLSYLIVFGMPKYSASNVQVDKAKDVADSHRLENFIIKDKQYNGVYYLVDGELLNVALKDKLSLKQISRLKKDLVEKIKEYNLIMSDDEIFYKEGSVSIKVNDEWITRQSPLLIKYDVFKRFIEGSEYTIRLPQIKYIELSLFNLNDECPLCNKKFQFNDDIRFFIDKAYHKECIINNREKLYNENKNSLLRKGEKDISEIEFWKRAYNISRRNILIRGSLNLQKEEKKEEKQKVESTQTVQKEETKESPQPSQKEEKEVKVEEKKEEIEMTEKEKEILEEINKYIEKPVESSINIEEFFPGLKEIKDNEQ